MLTSSKRYPNHQQSSANESLLELLLFIDRRSCKAEDIQKIEVYLESLQSECAFKLEVIEIEQQPHLVEHLKLVATPALVKMIPPPRQVLAGSDLIGQLERWWSKWKVIPELDTDPEVKPEVESSIAAKEDSYYSADRMELKDEIFSLKKEKQDLAAQLRFKEQIIAMLAHDLRSPLTAASMAVETIEIAEANPKLETAKLISLKQKLFARAKSQLKIMEGMIGELLQNSRSMNAKLRVKTTSLNLSSLCGEIIAQFDARLKLKSMNFQSDIPPDLPRVYGDEELIRQLIVNLLDNAIKYTPEGGAISLSILHRTNQKVQVSICDTGPGIPLEARSQIFEDSFRLQRDRDREGYGIGLAMCRQIVSAHHGQIWVESSPDSGSCFQFTLLVYQ